MKRPRSYGDDVDDAAAAGEKGGGWARRDQDPEYPSSSSHRRFYSKPDGSRKAPLPPPLSPYDRGYDDDRESSRLSRRRMDHDGDGFDRPRKGYDRYRDSVSPRGSYGSDRIHRSDSFSGLRREFPKGFRSERDRSRREGGGSGGSSWRRSSAGSGKEAAPLGAGDDAEDYRARIRRRDFFGGDQSRRLESPRMERPRKESCNSSEMEEGELEPDPQPKASPLAEPSPSLDVKKTVEAELEGSKDKEVGFCSQTEVTLERKEEAQEKTGLENDGVGDCSGKDEGSFDSKMLHQNDESVPESDGKGSGDGEADEKDMDTDSDNLVDDNISGNPQQVPKEEKLCAPCPGPEDKCNDAEPEDKEEKIRSHPFCSANEVLENVKEDKGAVGGNEPRSDEEPGPNHEVEMKDNHFDLEVQLEGDSSMPSSQEEVIGENVCDDGTLKLMTEKPNDEDKGKHPAFTVSRQEGSVEDYPAMEDHNRSGFELEFQSDSLRAERVPSTGIDISKQEDDELKLGMLDLSLGLPGSSQAPSSKGLIPKSDPPTHARSIQSFASSFCTNSDDFTASMSFTSSQHVSHNRSCSLNQKSFDKYEQSVGSRPLFQAVDHVSNSTIWQPQTSNEVKLKGGGATALLQRALQHGSASQNTFHAGNGQLRGKPNGLQRQSSFSGQFSPTRSHGFHDSLSEHDHGKRQLKRGRSSSTLFRSEQKERDQVVVNGVGVIERIISKIVSEPLHLSGRMLQEMTDPSVVFLKEAICEMLTNAGQSRQIIALQDALRRRSDLTIETISRCPLILLEILVAIKTSLPCFIKKSNSVAISDLVEIFLNLKCPNLGCRSMLPVDDCDCKICKQNSGFCSACMCIVCSKFDTASNTCSWVGCDVCLHWCHIDCGLHNSLIKYSVSGSQGNEANEMQFHCAACDHPSEMFGFVKEVFKTCIKDWRAETLVKELQYVRRIFSSSSDARGKRLQDIADQMLVKLEDKANHSEVVKHLMAFLSDDETDATISPLLPLKESSGCIAEGSNGIPSSTKEMTWLRSLTLEKAFRVENAGIISHTDNDLVGRQRMAYAESQANLEKNPVIDELDSLVKFKQAEAKMYQERANDARTEAEGLKRIATAKNIQINEHYTGRVAKLQIIEAEERRKQKLEELQVIERAYNQYFSMKMRMEAEIRDLLLKMEATRRNFNT